MLQRLGIRGKILAVVAVPIIVLLLAAGFVTFNAVGDLRSSRETEQLLTFVDDSGTLVAALQDERFIAANYDHSASNGLEKRTAARKALDGAIAALDASTAGGSSDAAAANKTAHAILNGWIRIAPKRDQIVRRDVPACDHSALDRIEQAAELRGL